MQRPQQMRHKPGQLRSDEVADATSAEWLEGVFHASQPMLEYGESQWSFKYADIELIVYAHRYGPSPSAIHELPSIMTASDCWPNFVNAELRLATSCVECCDSCIYCRLVLRTIHTFLLSLRPSFLALDVPPEDRTPIMASYVMR